MLFIIVPSQGQGPLDLQSYVLQNKGSIVGVANPDLG